MAATPLINSLHDLRRKVKVLSVAVGVGLVLASVVGVVLAAVLLDYTLNLPALPRFVVILAALFGIGAAVYYQIVKPAMTRLSISDVAGRLENAFPTFDDRLRSTVDFADGHVPGSEVMKDRVIEQASALAQQVDLNRAIVLKPVMYSLGGGIGALIVAVALAVASPSFTQTALARLFNPFTGPAWPKRVQIAAAALPARVPVGQAITVKMKLTKGDRPGQKAIVYYQSDNGIVQQEYMSRSGDGFTASFDAKGDHMKVWMSSGDDQTDPAAIAVVQRLQITRVEALITPPAYAKLPPASINLNNGAALATVGSGMLLKVSFNKQLDLSKPVILEPSGTDAKLPGGIRWDRSIAMEPQAAWAVFDSYRFRVKATDTDGFANAGLEEYEIIARPDQPPSVQIEEPRRNMELTPQAHLPVQIAAEDDFGITNMTLIADRVATANSSTTQPASGHWEIPLTGWKNIDGSADRQRFRKNYDWELAQTLTSADLKPGDVLEYYVTVKDNYDLPDPNNPNGPHLSHAPVPSGKLRVNIISQEQLADLVLNEHQEVMKHIDDALNSQKSTKAQTETLAQDTKGKPEFNKGDHDAAERVAQQQSTITSQTQQISGQMQKIAEQLDMNRSPRKDLADLTKDVQQQLNQTAENPMKDAGQKINEANQNKSDPKAGEAQKQQSAQQMQDRLAQAQQSQQQAADQLQQTLNKMSSSSKFSDILAKWEKDKKDQEEIARKYEQLANKNLGKSPEQMSPEDRKQLDDLAKQQQDAQKQTESAKAATEKAAEQMAKSDPQASQAMKNAAQQAQSQAIPQQQQQAQSDMKDNKSSSAKAHQQQADLGLQTVLDTLRKEEQRKLEELAAKLDQARQAIEALVRQQAGHNIDNLMIRGGAALKLISDELLQDANRQLTAKPVVPTTPQLAENQEATERNTRAVAKKVEELPDGAGPNEKLILAAGKMGYAITNLRDAKLVEAYDPHQVGALALLKEALKTIDEQKENVDEQKQQEQKDKIREAYIKVRDEQIAKINKATPEFEAAKAHLKHDQELALAALRGVQGGLAERVENIGKDLHDLGSVVYDWANTDIAKSMRNIKDDLAKPDTGQATQAEQQRVVDQLNAMIDDLAIKPPPKSKFAKSGGGGGGGGGGSPPPKMPTEAELRLLKDLQTALKNSTQKVAALDATKQDPSTMVFLGDRQQSLRDLLGKLAQQAGAGDIGPGPSKDDVALPPEKPAPKQDDQPADPDAQPAQPLDGNIIKVQPKVAPPVGQFEMAADDAQPADAAPGARPVAIPVKPAADAQPAPGADKLPAVDTPDKTDEKLDDQELMQALLRDAQDKQAKDDAAQAKAQDDANSKIKDVGDNMARSKIRLSDLRDPGQTTQKIQERVISDLDVLIEEVRNQQQQQQQQSSSPPKPGQGEKPGQPGGQKPENQGSQPGQKSQKGGSQAAQGDQLSAANENSAVQNDIKETAESMIKESPRLHDAVIEAETEHPIERDKNLVDDYYRALATKSAEKK